VQLHDKRKWQTLHFTRNVSEAKGLQAHRHLERKQCSVTLTSDQTCYNVNSIMRPLIIGNGQ